MADRGVFAVVTVVLVTLLILARRLGNAAPAASVEASYVLHQRPRRHLLSTLAPDSAIIADENVLLIG
jgi:hypothetical protein